MKIYTLIPMFALLTGQSGAYASDSPRKPLSEVTVASLKLGTTVEQYKQINPKAVFKPLDKDGLLHHSEYVVEETKKQNRTKLVLEADQSGYIYSIRYKHYYPTPIIITDVDRDLTALYGEPIGSSYDNVAIHCWHGCTFLPPSNEYATRTTDRLLVHTRQPQFFVVVYGSTEENIKDYSRHGISDQLPNGWLEYNLIDGERQDDVKNNWEARLIRRDTKKVEISPN